MALGAHYGQVVLKRGRHGASLGGRNGIELTLPAPAVDMVDSTGAGDAFAAGFVAALLAGEDKAAAMGKAIAAGARAVQSIGGQPG